jgi:hypothetical protein
VRNITSTLLIPAFVLATSGAPAQVASTGGQTTADANLQKEDEAARVQTAEEVLEQTAQGYARTTGVGIEEAKRRVLAMKELRAVKARIQQAHGGRLAGISTQHSPSLQVSVLLTGDVAVPAESVTAGEMTVPIVYRTGARSTIQQLRAALKQHQAAMRTLLPGVQGIGISTKTGELVVIVNATGVAATAAMAKDAELETLTGVPIRIRTLDGVDINMDVRGGSRLTDCTSGFVVKNTSGTTGVATAAHCANVANYYNPNGSSIPLTMVAGSEYFNASQDVQIHTSAYIERAEFYVDTAKTLVRRPVGSLALDATWEGDGACHTGETTGATCSLVEYVYFTPSPDKCGPGGYCADTYVAVTGPNCQRGDSGGPVYELDLAYGLLKGGSVSSTGVCNYYYYMPMDFLSSGWSLLLG